MAKLFSILFVLGCCASALVHANAPGGCQTTVYVQKPAEACPCGCGCQYPCHCGCQQGTKRCDCPR